MNNSTELEAKTELVGMAGMPHWPGREQLRKQLQEGTTGSLHLSCILTRRPRAASAAGRENTCPLAAQCLQDDEPGEKGPDGTCRARNDAITSLQKRPSVLIKMPKDTCEERLPGKTTTLY